MKRIFSLAGLAALIALVSCTDTTGPKQDREVPAPTLAASWAAKYPLAPACVNGNTLGVNELIIHGEVWEGFASNGWLQYARWPSLEQVSPERTVEMEVYSFQGANVNTRCRNYAKVLTWAFYDSPSQTPTHHNISYVNSTKQTVDFSPTALTQIGDGNEILTSDGLWEIGRDHWVVKAYPRQLDNTNIVLDTVRDTLAVDAMIQWPQGCPPNQLQNPTCRP